MLKLRNTRYGVGVKTAILGIILGLINNQWLIAIIFVLMGCYFYFWPALNNRQLSSSFLILTATSLSAVFIAGKIEIKALFFSLLFFLLLGIKNFVFINRQRPYYLLNGFLLLSVLLLFFSADKSEFFIFKYSITGLAIFLLSREFLMFGLKEFIGLPGSLNLIPAAFAFLMLQILWAIALLPIGFLNATSLALLSALIFQDFAMHHFSGTISRRIILRNVTIFLILNLIVFAASKWQL